MWPCAAALSARSKRCSACRTHGANAPICMVEISGRAGGGAGRISGPPFEAALSARSSKCSAFDPNDPNSTRSAISEHTPGHALPLRVQLRRPGSEISAGGGWRGSSAAQASMLSPLGRRYSKRRHIQPRTDPLRSALHGQDENPAGSTPLIDRARRRRLRGECRVATKCLCRAPQAGSSPAQ